MTNQDSLRIHNVTKQYPGFTLGPLNFDLPAGYIMGLVGPNGAGKSTTISLILDEVKASSGEITVMGAANSPLPLEMKERIGVVFDSSVYVEGWTVSDVATALAPFYTSWDSNRFEELLDTFGLDPRKKIKDLSRGMKVKLTLAVAFSHNARLLLLDEPTSGLDPASRDEFTTLLQEFIEDGERSVLFSTHITSDLDKVADFIVVLNQGHQEFAGTVEELHDSYVLVKGEGMTPDDPRWHSLIGTRKGLGAFEGMIPADKQEDYQEFLQEKPSIEEIVTYIGRGTHHDKH